MKIPSVLFEPIFHLLQLVAYVTDERRENVVLVPTTLYVLSCTNLSIASVSHVHYQLDS